MSGSWPPSRRTIASPRARPSRCGRCATRRPSRRPPGPAGGRGAAARRTVTLRALRDEALIALPPGTGGRTALERAFAALGLAPRIALEAGDPLVLMELARRGLGVAIVPESAPEDLHVLALRPALRSRLELVWRAGEAPSPAARELLARTRAALAAR